MLSKREERLLVDIGFELWADRPLRRVIGAPTSSELRRLTFRRRCASFIGRWRRAVLRSP